MRAGQKQLGPLEKRREGQRDYLRRRKLEDPDFVLSTRARQRRSYNHLKGDPTWVEGKRKVSKTQADLLERVAAGAETSQRAGIWILIGRGDPFPWYVIGSLGENLRRAVRHETVAALIRKGLAVEMVNWGPYSRVCPRWVGITDAGRQFLMAEALAKWGKG